jgi:hypothetical protein
VISLEFHTNFTKLFVSSSWDAALKLTFSCNDITQIVTCFEVTKRGLTTKCLLKI